MSEITLGRSKTFKAGAVAIPQGTIVKFDTDGTVICSTSATEVHIGIAEQATVANGQCSVILRDGMGTAKVVASTTISVGAKITATTAGQAVTTTADHAEVVGVALEAATAQGDLIEVMLANYTLSA
jgi:hypothetical protein